MTLFFEPNIDLALLALRLSLGIVFLAHGPAKLTENKQLAQAVGTRPEMIMLLGLGETLSAAAVILGIWAQIGAALLATVMLGAIYFKTQKWGKKFAGEGGWEFEFTLLAAALTVLIGGAGSYSLLG